MLRIGLTGGIGTGKSTVASMFARRGVPVIDADEIGRELTRPGTEGYAAVVHEFGNDIVRADATIDRSRLRAHVFGDASARRRLESILHPRIRTEVERRLAQLDAPYVLVVVPLLIETDFAALVERILLVDTSEERQIARTMARSGLNRGDVQKILAAQSPRAARLARTDDTIVNDADLNALDAQVDALHKRYLALAASP